MRLGNGESSTMKNFIVGTVHLIYSGISGIFRWVRYLVRMEDGSSALKILIGEPTGKHTRWRPRRWWEDNIWMDLKEIGLNTGICFDLT